MGKPVHRHDDGRVCGAKTVVTEQTTVLVNGKRWAVRGSKNDHGAGDLIPTKTGIKVEYQDVIVHYPDHAATDNQFHPTGATDTSEGSPNVFAYE